MYRLSAKFKFSKIVLTPNTNAAPTCTLGAN